MHEYHEEVIEKLAISINREDFVTIEEILNQMTPIRAAAYICQAMSHSSCHRSPISVRNIFERND